MAVTLDTKNLATQDGPARFVADRFTEELTRVRRDKLELHLRTEAYDRIWQGKLDKQSYNGRHKAYLAAGRKMAASFQHQLYQACFPQSEWFQTDLVENIVDEARRQAMHDLQRHHLDGMRLKFHFPPFAQQLLVRGTSPVKQGYEQVMRKVRSLVRRDPGRAKTITQEVVLHYGPTFRVADFYSVYVDPPTVACHDEATLIFEDKMVSESHVRQMARRWLDPEDESLGHVYEKVEDALAGRAPDAFLQERRIRLKQRGIVDPLDSYPMDGLHQLSECWWRGEIPGATHRDDETGEEVETGETLWLITLLNSTWPLRIQQNPFWYGTVPWHIPRLIREEGEFWGHSLFEGADRLQYLMNDVMNHTLDLFSLVANPIAMIDPSAHPRANTLRVLPLAKWLIRPDAVRLDRPPDATPSGVSLVNQLQAMFDDYSQGNAPGQGRAAARGRGRAGNTATGMGFMIANQHQIVQAIGEDLAEELFQPILQTNVLYDEQFMTDAMILRIGGMGTAPLVERRVAIEDVLGRYAFRWLAATATREKATLATQMERLLPLLVSVQQAGVAPGLDIDFAYIIRRIWQDGLGLHGADRAIRTADQQPSISPDIEHDLLAERRPIEVRPGDDDLGHLEAHMTVGLRRFEGRPDEAQQLLAHIGRHSQQAEAKMAAQEMAQQRMMAGPGGGPGGPPAGAPTPQGARQQSMPSGDGTQPEADLARMNQNGGMP